MKKTLQLQDHFSLVKRMDPDVQVCTFDDYGIKEKINKWTVNNLGRWVDKMEFFSLAEFEDQCGKLSQWENVTLVNAESLVLFYNDAADFYDTGYIVVPKKEFFEYKEKKPTLFTNYYIKDKFAELRRKLPELKDIF